jgi:hypothetical protein
LAAGGSLGTPRGKSAAAMVMNGLDPSQPARELYP